MGAFKIIQGFLNKAQKFFDGFAFRREKKYGTIQETEDSVSKTRKMISIFLILAFLLFASVVAIREGVIWSGDFVINREIPSAPRDVIRVDSQINKSDLDILSSAVSSNGTASCARLSAKLLETGFLLPAEKKVFLTDCAPSLPPDVGASMAKILNLNLAPETAKALLANLGTDNAAQISKALDNESVVASLKSDGGTSVAESMKVLSALTPEEAAEAAAIIVSVPPQYRATTLATISEIGAVSDPKARKALLTSLSQSKSPEDVQIIRNFAKAVKELTPDEQKSTSEAFVKLATPGAKKAMTKAVVALAAIPLDDPMRGRILTALVDLPNQPPEAQEIGAMALANIATHYVADGEAKKMAIEDAFKDATTTPQQVALSDRINTLSLLGDAPVTPKDISQFLLAADPNATSRVSAAANAMSKGAKEDAAALLSGGILPEKSVYQTPPPITSASPVSDASTPQIAKKKLDDSVAELADTRSQISKTEAEIYNLKSLNLNPTDPELVKTYSRLAALKASEVSLVESVEKAKSVLRAKILAFKNSASAEFASMGVIMPALVMPVDESSVGANAPSERLTDLRDTVGFYNDQSSRLSKRKKIQLGEFAAGGLPSRGSILSQAVAGMPSNWVVSGGPGSSGSGDVVSGFAMSRTQYAGGVLLKVPPAGIPSDKAAKYTLYFQFMGSVADRKTGLIAIPSGSIALCKVADFDKNTGKLTAKCDKIDVGGREDIDADLALSDADGSDGLSGAITDNRGWYLAGVFLTAFSSAILDGYVASAMAPLESKAQKTLGDYTAKGSASGASLITKDIAEKQIEEWQKAPFYWHSFNGALATVHQN